MTSETTHQKSDYQKELRKRCDAFAFEFRRDENGDYTDELFYTFVREIALESFKNGKKVGAGKDKSAPTKRSALVAGKLQPKA